MISDDTRLVSIGRWVTGSNVRFWEERPEIIGGWESLISTLLTGVCRDVYQWKDKSALQNIAFGTHSNLQLWQGGALYDITPTLALPSIALGANPLTTVISTPSVTFTWNGHPLTTSDTIDVSGASAVGGITPNGTGFAISAVTTNTVTFTFSSNATSSVAGGGGSAVVITPKRAFTAGQIDGTGTAGFGSGAFSVGAFSTPSTGDYFPRTAGMASWGENLVYAPRNGTLYLWTNSTGTPAQPIQNAPWKVKHALVSHTDQIFALGCNEEVSGVFNPLCLRHSSVRNSTDWTTTNSSTAREYILPGGGEIVAGRAVGPYLLIWTTNALFLGTYLGSIGQPWQFTRVGQNCGLIGPNAVVVVGQRAYWMSPDKQFRTYSLGSEPTILPCPIRTDMADNLAASQGDKIVASGISKFGEIRFDYPDARDGYENSRYIAVSVTNGWWYNGTMARTAMVDAGPSDSPIGVTYSGNIYWHERGTSADGSALSWSIETGELMIDESVTSMIRCVWPDTRSQVGAWSLTLQSRLKPNSLPRSFGPYTFTSTQEKVDIRASGRLFRFIFSGSTAPAAGRFGRPIFDVVSAGQR